MNLRCNWRWIWKAPVAGFCGSTAHTLLMFVKSRTGLLPAFQPYDNFQAALGRLIGGHVDPVIPWAMSFLNGSTLLGLCFGWAYPRLPGRTGAAKGFAFGLVGWVVMGVLLFPLLELGTFATELGLGIAPALFSLAMLMAYSIVMGMVYAALTSWSATMPHVPNAE
jgi:Family of unknown function (DUF6789)